MQDNNPQLEYIIAKIKRCEELTIEEELIYLMHIEGYSESEALKDLMTDYTSKSNKENT